ncbi:hypothetical protein BVG19_g4707 [[Candida] boidinii]|nr:hypothetical protein BVG19_g4707 [[Candida] boidinii]OWB52206.1 hypothetical protein B5S27_g3778 [[Candida] boidinii]OWB86344.1 hypothetical protein B5S33_g5031 [[Candida] boidinii]
MTSVDTRRTSMADRRPSMAERRPSMAERRPSMAERRPSMVERPHFQQLSQQHTSGSPLLSPPTNAQHLSSSLSAASSSSHLSTLQQQQQPKSRRPSVIPGLAGIEKPEITENPDECDVLICGTGLVESLLASALAWQGSNVLHVDCNPYYGDTSATLTIDQIKSWCENVNLKTPGFIGFEKALLYIPRPYELNSRDYSIDLTPKIMFAQSDLLSLLIKSRVYRYLEFQSLSAFHTFENDTFGKMSSSKEEIFTDQSLSLSTKRILMKFMKFVFEYDQNLDSNKALLDEYKHKPLLQFIRENYTKMDSKQINELVFTLGLSPSEKINTLEGLSRIKRYLVSFNVYGNFPSLVSKFGGPGEISQGFCRSAAVAGTIYKLDNHLKSYDPVEKIATFTNNSKVKVTEKIVCSPSQAPENAKYLPKQNTYEVTRLITIVKKSCKEWFSENESSAIVVFSPMSLPTKNKYPIQIIIMGASTGCCPNDQCIWYLSTIEKGEKARQDLESALLKMEESILRESEDGGFDLDGDLLNDKDLIVSKNDGMELINSVKLGKSFKEFVPKQKLVYLFKLCFTQYTAIKPFGIINEKIFQDIENNNSLNLDNLKLDNSAGSIPVDKDIIYSNMPSTEISYDGCVTEAKYLYKKIVGSDDDFFDVDFEDDDEDDATIGDNNTISDATSGVNPSVLDNSDGTQSNNQSRRHIDEEAIIDEEDEDEFNDEMDFEL